MSNDVSGVFLTPMALGVTGKGGFISQPLAAVVIGGLLSSTVLTLVVLPIHRRATLREPARNRDRSFISDPVK